MTSTMSLVFRTSSMTSSDTWSGIFTTHASIIRYSQRKSFIIRQFFLLKAKKNIPSSQKSSLQVHNHVVFCTARPNWKDYQFTVFLYLLKPLCKRFLLTGIYYIYSTQ